MVIQDIVLTCIREIEANENEMSFINGITGFAWTLKHISLILKDDSDFLLLKTNFIMI